MIVCIAEKPSVARDIAHVIGATKSCNGYMEGNGYQVTWTFGHLCCLKEPDDYTDAWKRWTLSALPMLPPRFGIKLIKNEGIEKQFHIIETLIEKADEIINCGDAGQEGELIQRWVMQKAGAKCPVKRLWISSLTEEAIREGFQHLEDQSKYQSLYMAGLSRVVGDWLLGMNATRLYTLKYGQLLCKARGEFTLPSRSQRSVENENQVLSIGRVQTPTLALIVNRQREIDTFVPHQSWLLSTLYRDTKFTAVTIDEEVETEESKTKGKKAHKTAYKQMELTSESEGRALIEQITDKPFTIVSVTKKAGTETPPHLYDLTSLQVDCNKKFSFSADATLQIIQGLYEKKFTTYPRVDTTYLSEDIYAKCPATLNGLFKTTLQGQKPYADLIRPLGGKPLKKSRKVFDTSKVTDHHAIIPTGVPPQGLSDMEQKVFDLIARSFIAVFYPDCRFDTTTVMGEVDTDRQKIMFRSTGKTITSEGWKVVFHKVDEEKDSDSADSTQEATLPAFKRGESGPQSPSLSEKWTLPPKPYTEATLLRAMETAGKFVENEELREAMKENGIGRPSTRAAIIETLFKRNYIRKERKNLIPTPTGVALIDIIHEDMLKSPELTGIWEKRLRNIEHHKYDAGQFVEELKQQVTNIVHNVLSDNTSRKVNELTL